MNRITRHQVLPPNVVRERVKHMLFTYMYEHNDVDFLDVVAKLLQYITESDEHGIGSVCTLDCTVDKFLKANRNQCGSDLEHPKRLRTK